MKICVIGSGYVGLVTGACLADSGNQVICVDSDKEKVLLLSKGSVPIHEPGLSELVQQGLKRGRLRFTTDIKQAVEQSLICFIAVGTPSAADGSADLSAVMAVAQQIGKSMPDYRIIATKSTVPVGTCKTIKELISSLTPVPFDYVSNPEFLKEGAAVEDFQSPDRIIVGTDNPAVREIFRQLYAPFMRRNSRILFMDPLSAEMTKYAANAMLATRISFMNEIALLCEAVGADVELVRQGVGSDHRIGGSFLFPGVGFGGSCFPKDLRALVHTGRQHGLPMLIASAVQKVNQDQHDWFSRKVIDYFHGQDGVTVAVWGLAFKARTDDVRESPAVYCVKRFLKAGLSVKAYDPAANQTALAELGSDLRLACDAYEALEGADALVVLTDWQEFRNPDLEIIAKKLRRPVVFDGRNLYDPLIMRKAGFEYYCVGRPAVNPEGKTR
ncbi:MAG: UDP-glucose/GDP-mannose dehydrogenase family protein [Sedimentisphaerales bacterium]|nr:UDP-glucose/GDP-mannose dehydrogenase family protein [Sedimentisphaerales bacterium]